MKKKILLLSLILIVVIGSALALKRNFVPTLDAGGAQADLASTVVTRLAILTMDLVSEI